MRWLFAIDFHKYSKLVNTIPKPLRFRKNVAFTPYSIGMQVTLACWKILGKKLTCKKQTIWDILGIRNHNNRLLCKEMELLVNEKPLQYSETNP